MAVDGINGSEQGIIQPMGAERRNQPYAPAGPDIKTAVPKENFIKRFWKARLSKKQLAETAVATAGAASVAGTFLGQVTAGKGNENANTGEVTGSENVVTVEITPTTKTPSGETIVPGTNVAIGKGAEIGAVTPTVVATETPKPTETPKTPEKPASAWSVGVGQGVEGKSKIGLTVEQQVTLIQDTLANFPKIGEIKITLVEGYQSFAGTSEITIGRDISADAMVWFVNHEMTHHYDPTIYGEQLSKYLTADQINQLKTLREQVLSDPVWGREYPDLSKMLNPRKSNLAIDFSKGYNLEQIVQLSNKYADGIWLGRRLNSSGEPSKVWENLMPETYQKLDSYAKNNEGVKGVLTMNDFLKLPSVQSKVAELSASDPLFAKGIELISKDSESLKLENLNWNSTSAPILTASDGFSGWYCLKSFVLDSVLSEAYLKGDSFVVNLVNSRSKEVGSDKAQRFNYFLNSLKSTADSERFADLIAAGKSFKVATPGDKYIEALWKFVLVAGN